MPYKKLQRNLKHSANGRITRKSDGDYNSFPGGVSRWEFVESYVSPGPPYTKLNPFVHILHDAKPLRLNAEDATYTYKNLILAGYASHGFSYPEPNWIGLTNEALAQLNPNKPVMDVPLFLFELRELPRALRDLGRRISTLKTRLDFGSDYLSYQFGWAPLFNDLRLLFSIAKEMEARIESLKENAQRERVKGKLSGNTFSQAGWVNERWRYGGSRLYLSTVETYTETNWFTASFEVNPSDLPSLSNEGLKRMEWALGLKISPSQIWNAIPWTWLIDYFSTIGSFLSARRGGIPFRAHDMCIMSQGQYIRTYREGTRPSSGFTKMSLDGGQMKGTIKRRKVFPLPTSKIRFMPLLSVGQMANLAALASSRNSAFIRSG